MHVFLSDVFIHKYLGMVVCQFLLSMYKECLATPAGSNNIPSNNLTCTTCLWPLVIAEFLYSGDITCRVDDSTPLDYYLALV